MKSLKQQKKKQQNAGMNEWLAFLNVLKDNVNQIWGVVLVVC